MSGLHERARQQIALLAGDDLEGEEQAEAQQSVTICPDCRDHLLRLRGCLDILDRTGRSAETVSGPSLWPALEPRLQPIAVRRSDQFNGWVPALSMAAACIALLIAGQMDDVAPPDVSGAESFRTTFMTTGSRLHQVPMMNARSQQVISLESSGVNPRLMPIRQEAESRESGTLAVPVRSRFPEWYR